MVMHNVGVHVCTVSVEQAIQGWVSIKAVCVHVHVCLCVGGVGCVHAHAGGGRHVNGERGCAHVYLQMGLGGELRHSGATTPEPILHLPQGIHIKYMCARAYMCAWAWTPEHQQHHHTRTHARMGTDTLPCRLSIGSTMQCVWGGVLE